MSNNVRRQHKQKYNFGDPLAWTPENFQKLHEAVKKNTPSMSLRKEAEDALFRAAKI